MKKLTVQKVVGALRKNGIKKAECYKHNDALVVVDPRNESIEEIKDVLVNCEGMKIAKEQARMVMVCK